MGKTYITIILMLATSSLLGANISSLEQSVTETDNSKKREWLNSFPEISYDNGLVIESKKKLAKTTFNFRMQNMLGMTLDDDFNLEQTTAYVRRLRFCLKGYVYSPKYTYQIMVGLASAEMRPTPNGNSNALFDAVFTYKPNSTWEVAFGQRKLPFNREQMNSSMRSQFVDRSIMNNQFRVARDVGVFGGYTNRLGENFDIVANVSVTLGEGANFVSSSKSGFAYTGQVELYPMGKFTSNSQQAEGTYVEEDDLKMMIAGGYLYNDRAKRTAGQEGALFSDEKARRNLHNYFFDISLKYKGFAFYTDWMGRMCHNPLVEAGSLGDQYVYTGNGVNIQGSYTHNKKWEFALRNSTLIPNKIALAKVGYDNYNQSTIGITRYIWGHNIKLQADASYGVKAGMDESEYNPFEFRFQLELGF